MCRTPVLPPPSPDALHLHSPETLLFSPPLPQIDHPFACLYALHMKSLIVAVRETFPVVSV